MVARGCEHAKAFPADQRVHGAFSSAQTFFDNNAPASFSEGALFQHRANRLARLLRIVCDDHSFTQRQPLRLDHHRERDFAAIIQCLLARRKCPRLRRRNLFRVHQFLGEDLRCFQLRRFLVRTENAQSFRFEQVHNPAGERVIRTDYGEINLFLLRETHELRQFTCRDRNVLANFFSAGVSRCAENAIYLGRFRQFPRQRVFTAATSDDENLHKVERALGAGERQVWARVFRVGQVGKLAPLRFWGRARAACGLPEIQRATNAGISAGVT